VSCRSLEHRAWALRQPQRRSRHPGLDRLVQSPPAARGQRRPPADGAGAGALPSHHRPHRDRI